VDHLFARFISPEIQADFERPAFLTRFSIFSTNSGGSITKEQVFPLSGFGLRPDPGRFPPWFILEGFNEIDIVIISAITAKIMPSVGVVATLMSRSVPSAILAHGGWTLA
jgi:hypothetical protein